MRDTLHGAALVNNTETGRLLLDAGADSNTVYYGMWPLHTAVIHGKSAFCKLLLERGAKIRTRVQKSYMEEKWFDTTEYDLHGLEPLHIAAFLGHTDICRVLLEHGAAVTDTARAGLTPLHVASIAGNKAVCQLLIDAGANVEALTNNHRTPLFMAVAEEKFNIIRFLAYELPRDKRANLFATDSFGRSLMHFAAHYGLTEVAQLLARLGVDPKSKDKEGATPLHIAALEGHKDMCNFLISQGCKLDEGDKNGETPLHYTIQSNSDLYEFLIKKGASLSARDNDGQTPLHYALSLSPLSLIKSLVALGADLKICIEGDSLLHCAARWGHTEEVAYLVENGLDINIRDQNNDTPLIDAIRSGNLTMCQLVVRLGADVNARCFENRRALHFAAEGGFLDICKFLLDKGADKTAADSSGRTPLFSALAHPEVCSFLIENGGGEKIDLENIVLKDRREDEPYTPLTPLMEAAASGQSKTCQILLDAGGDTDETLNNFSALNFACYRGDLDTVRLLLAKSNVPVTNHLLIAAESGSAKLCQFLIEKGANPLSRNTENMTPLHLAASAGHEELCKFFIAQRCPLNLKGYEGNTALHFAAKNGKDALCSILLLEMKSLLNETNDQGFTPLHSAAASGHFTTYNLLVTNGSDVTARTLAGKTALEIAFDNGHRNLFMPSDWPLTTPERNPAIGLSDFAILSTAITESNPKKVRECFSIRSYTDNQIIEAYNLSKKLITNEISLIIKTKFFVLIGNYEASQADAHLKNRIKKRRESIAGEWNDNGIDSSDNDEVTREYSSTAETSSASRQRAHNDDDDNDE